MRLIDWNLLKKVSTLKRGVLFNWLLMIYSIFCTTKVSPKRDHQVLKIKLELEKLILDHHIVVVVVMIIGL